jgi:hypothetical protein
LAAACGLFATSLKYLPREIPEVLTFLAGFHSLALRIRSSVLGRQGLREYEENPMQDLFQNYVDDLIKLREAFHDELAAEAQELAKAMDIYARDSKAALTLFMEEVSARGAELEAAAAVRLNQFRGLPANGLPNVSDGPLSPADADQERVAAAAERAFADSLDLESEDRKPKSGRPMVLVKSDTAA